MDNWSPHHCLGIHETDLWMQYGFDLQGLTTCHWRKCLASLDSQEETKSRDVLFLVHIGYGHESRNTTDVWGPTQRRDASLLQNEVHMKAFSDTF